jgi:hypothetical protein
VNYLLISITLIGSLFVLAAAGLAIFTGIDMMRTAWAGVLMRWIMGPLNILMGLLAILLYATLFMVVASSK